jgi:large subunit ribosomal protein L3
MKFILGSKIGMTQIFDQSGKRVPVTLVEAGPCQVLQQKTKEKDGYDAFQIGFLKIEKEKKLKKSAKNKPYRFQKEFKNGLSDQAEGQKEGSQIDVSIFDEGDKVKISGISKGKGFQGAVKLWNFKGRNATHGVKHEHRTLGSVGFTGPQRVFKGKKMSGRMGAERVTVRNMKIVKIDKENNIIALKGAVPGRKGTLIEIKGI